MPASAEKSITEPFATPSPIDFSSSSRLPASPARTGATTVSADWYGTGGVSPGELQREVEDLRLLPEDEPEVEAGRDFADLVADPLSHDRGLGVVEDDRLLAVEPALVPVDLRADRLQPEGQDLVAELTLLAVEHLPLPCEQVDELRGGLREARPGRDENGTVGLSVRDLSGGARPEEVVQLGRGLVQQVGNVESRGHGTPLSSSGRGAPNVAPVLPRGNRGD